MILVSRARLPDPLWKFRTSSESDLSSFNDAALRWIAHGATEALRRATRGVHHRRVGDSPLRVVIAEDSALIREGIARLIQESGGTVVAKVGDGPSFVEAVVAHRPDVSVVDVRMPPTQRDEGLRAAIEARRRVPGTPILVLSQYVERQYATELLADRAGGVGYLLKDRVGDIREFMDALRRVARGGTALDPEVVAQLMVRNRRRRPAGRADAA